MRLRFASFSNVSHVRKSIHSSVAVINEEFRYETRKDMDIRAFISCLLALRWDEKDAYETTIFLYVLTRVSNFNFTELKYPQKCIFGFSLRKSERAIKTGSQNVTFFFYFYTIESAVDWKYLKIIVKIGRRTPMLEGDTALGENCFYPGNILLDKH